MLGEVLAHVLTVRYAGDAKTELAQVVEEQLAHVGIVVDCQNVWGKAHDEVSEQWRRE